MKKSFLILLSAMVSLTSWAGSRTAQQMMQIAQQRLGVSVTLATVPTSNAKGSFSATDADAYVVYNASDGKGFAIIGADDRLPAVIGYSTSGSFSYDNIPPQLKALLDGIAENPLSAILRQDNATGTFEPVDTLVTTLWNQQVPYNRECPVYNGKTCPTGCVATALAQVINYWGQQGKFPTTGKESITWPSTDTKTAENVSKQVADLTDPIAFDKMHNSYLDPKGYDVADSVAIGHLMHICGALGYLQYGVSNSGGYLCCLDKIESNYGFAAGSKVVKSPYYSESEWRYMIYQELSNRRPIVYEAFKKSDDGHCFVLDGLDADGNVHVNWGWGGLSNGYYSLDIMLPTYEGIGAATGLGGYTQSPAMIIGFGDNVSTPQSEYYSKGIAYDVDKQQLSIIGLTACSHARKADLALYFIDLNNTQNTKIVPYTGTSVFPDTLTIQNYLNEATTTVATDLSTVDDGPYYLSIVSRDPGEDGWSMIRTPSNDYQTILVDVKDHKITNVAYVAIDYTKLTNQILLKSPSSLITGRNAYMRSVISNNTGKDVRGMTVKVAYCPVDDVNAVQKIISYSLDLKAGETDSLDFTYVFPTAGDYQLYVIAQLPTGKLLSLQDTKFSVNQGHTAEFYKSFQESTVEAPETVTLGQPFQIKLECTPAVDLSASVVLIIKDKSDNIIMSDIVAADFDYGVKYTKTWDVPGDKLTAAGRYAYACVMPGTDKQYYFFGTPDPTTSEKGITVVDPTGINDVVDDATLSGQAAAYDLMGRRVDAQTYKGIIIQNGKKHLNK